MLNLKSKLMKKAAALSLILSTSTLAVQTQPSHAAVGISAVNPVMVAIGAGMLFGATVFVAEEIRGNLKNRIVRGNGIGLAFYFGILIMDNSGSPELSYTNISAKEAELLGIPADHAELFNSHLSEVNAIRETVAAEMAKQMKANPEMNSDQLLTLSESLWNDYAQSIGELNGEQVDAILSVVQTLTQNFMKNMTEKAAH